MSRTIKGAKSAGYEFWSKRPQRGGGGHGPFAKSSTHRAERRQARREIESQLEPGIEPDSLFSEPDYDWWEAERYDDDLHSYVMFGDGDKDCFPVR